MKSPVAAGATVSVVETVGAGGEGMTTLNICPVDVRLNGALATQFNSTLVLLTSSAMTCTGAGETTL